MSDSVQDRQQSRELIAVSAAEVNWMGYTRPD